MGDEELHILGMDVDVSNREQRYSRQMFALGEEATDRIFNSQVVIYGCNGLGAEICKNLVLSGVKSITLIDDTSVELKDLSSNFFLRESDVGAPRAEVLAERLAELNNLVDVHCVAGPLRPSILDHASALVMTCGSLEETIEMDLECRAAGVHFVLATVHGMASRVFVDLGDEFEVQERSRSTLEPLLVESVTQDSPATVSILEEQRHHLRDGDHVTFSGVEGMTELNDGTPHVVTVTSPSSFTIDDNASAYGRYVSGGYVHVMPRMRKVAFKPLEQALSSPQIFGCQTCSPSRCLELHCVFAAVDQFMARGVKASSHFLPADLAELTRLAQQHLARLSVNLSSEQDAACASHPEVGRNLEVTVEQVLRGGAHAALAPMAAITAGIAAHEVLKACAQIQMPLQQFFYYDATKCLPDGVPSRDDCGLRESRHELLLALFGSSVQERLSSSKFLVAGAGAIGCEVLKEAALLGLGGIILADADCVELPNLAAQMMYRDSDLGRPKVEAAARAVCAINPELALQTHQLHVDMSSEEVFTSTFFEGIDGVFSCVDSGAARLLLDARCVFNRRPLIDGGKDGTMGSVHVFVPLLSEMYASTQDPPEHKEYPICTIKNFPYTAEHALQWALETFRALFTQRPRDVNLYLGTRHFVEELRRQPPPAQLPVLEALHDSLLRHRPLGFEACVEWARLQFEHLFCNSIKQLSFNFPADMTTTAGTPFWSGTKRHPAPLKFDPANAVHLDFIVAAANLQATVYGLKGCRDRAAFLPVLQNVVVPTFQPKEGVAIAVTDSEVRASHRPNSGVAAEAAAAAECEQFLQKLPAPVSLVGYRLTPIDFSPDDMELSSVDFVAAASSLRALNYDIQPPSKLKARMVAGRVVPALVATAGVLGGLMALELLKLVQNKPLPSMQHSYFNLAQPQFVSAQPLAAVVNRVVTRRGDVFEWTLWDRFHIDGVDISLQTFLDRFLHMTGLEITMLSHGRSLLFAEFLPKKKLQERLNMWIVDLVKVVGKVEVLASTKALTFSVTCTDANEADVEVPDVTVRIR